MQARRDIKTQSFAKIFNNAIGDIQNLFYSIIFRPESDSAIRQYYLKSENLFKTGV